MFRSGFKRTRLASKGNRGPRLSRDRRGGSHGTGMSFLTLEVPSGWGLEALWGVWTRQGGDGFKSPLSGERALTLSE